MVAGLSRKHERTNQYHVKNGSHKGGAADDGRLRRTKGAANDGESRATCPVTFLPERRYIVLPHVFSYDDNSVSSGISELSGPAEPQAGVSRILESFSCLCLGSELPRSSEVRRRDRRRLNSSLPQQSRVVYPIVSYPARLNSKKLVEQRRQSLQHHFFRPVQSNI